MSKNVLVTGAAGFIGSHTSQRLLTRGDCVVGIDNLNNYYDPARKQSNVDEVRTSAPAQNLFDFVEGDIRDSDLLERLFSENRFDAVVHLAAMAGVRASMDDPGLYLDVNLSGSMLLLEASRRHHVGNFVLASTSSVYGRTERVPFEESDACDRPLAPYPASKRAAEMLAFTYHHLYGQNVTCLRFFTVYGPRGRPDMMAYKVADSIVLGREAPLFNGGQMYRDWTYVSDIAAGLVAAVDRPLGYEVINLGRGEPVLLADFVRLVEEFAGGNAHLLTTPIPDADIVYTHADIAKARHLLGYDPKVSVPEGVKRFWQWYCEHVL